MLFILTCLVLAAPSAAQSTDAGVSGTVTDAAGQPLPGATVLLRNEATGFRTGTTTNAAGRFTLLQLPLGGPYVATVSFIGFATETLPAFELNLGDRIALEVVLREAALGLDEVVVSTDDLRSRVARLGSTTEISRAELRALPTQDRNFTNLAALTPGLGRGLNFLGARAIATNFTVDGLNARGLRTGGEQGRGPFSLTMEAIREFEVHTNNYDVTIGRQAGGGINAATRAGTNRFEASVFSYLRADWLTANQDFLGRPIDDQFSNVQWGFVSGGPLARDRAHFFVAFDRQDAARPVDVINLAGTQDEIATGITRENLSRVLEIARERYGLDPELPQVGSFTQNGEQNALFARVDWQFGPRHRLTAVNNLTHFTSNLVAGGDQLAFLESRPNRYSLVNTTRLTLRSSLTDDLLNVAQVQLNWSDDEARQDIGRVPRIFVRTESTLPDGTVGNRTLQLGGHRWSPNYSNERNVQLANTAYLTRGKVLYTLGADILASYHDVWISSEQFGLFEFNSIEDFEAMTPFRYSRLVPLRDEVTGKQFWALDAAVFGQADFRAHRDVNLTLGLRYDVHALLNRPLYNARVEERFGLRNDTAPLDLTNVQPRVQATWDVGGRGRDVVRAGFGGFSSFNNYYAYITNFLYNGLDLASISLTGSDVPTPDFPAYRRDPSTIPGVPAGANLDEVPRLIAFANKNARTPYTFKGNLAYGRFLTDRIRLGANLIGSYTFNNYHYFDRNLRQFFTTDPDNRPVFVPASSIRPNGNTNYFAGRQFAEFEHVLEMVSEGRAYSYGAILDAEARIGRDGRLAASYTYNVARENTPYNGNNAVSALSTRVSGDPRNLEWARAANDFRHKVVLRGSLPSVRGFVLSGSYVGISGNPINLVVNRDIMGTGTAGDELAFIFDPDDPATPPSVAQAMRNVLANPDNAFASYLRANLGRRAERFGVTGPFTGQVNLRLMRPFDLPTGQSLDVMLDVFNVMNLINSEWGADGFFGTNQTLLNVIGFDQATQQYQYRVNENIGQRRPAGTPYQIQLGARLRI
ncbi:MAG: carboxypeptidase regulatory-like domain-containing protein [Rubricoccaceae bacterium]